MSTVIRPPNTTAHTATADLAHLLAVPPPTPPDQRWRAQSLAEGAAGIALLHVERAHAGLGGWDTAHAWLKVAAQADISAAADAGLYFGAPALAFALHAADADRSGRYARALIALDSSVVALTHRRIDQACARIDCGELPRLAEFDVISGLSGIGAHLLRHTPGDDALERVLSYLVRLTEPLRIDGEVLPGWWTGHDPHFTTSPDYCGGHGNFGMAHGIAGPLALLALARRHGIAVAGHLDAIERICTWLDTWRQDHDAGPWWPQWITHDERRTGRVCQPGPLRPSWCYGTPGLARAQQLAGIATGNTARQQIAEHALAGCLADPRQLGRIIDLAVLAGTPLPTAAAQIAMEAADLADAIELYQAAGRAALEAQIDARGWYQVRVEFADWDTAEYAVATHVGPKLRQAETAGVVSSWWYIRKAPCWRLRFHAGTASLARMKEFVGRALDDMASQHLITRWWASIYEPETGAFGGSGGMDTAHHLFHADSNGILDYLSRYEPTVPSDHVIGRRELSILLCSALMRAAGQEWHEQGDVWHRVARMRPLPPGVPLDRLHGMTDNLHRLMALDTRPTTQLVGTDGPLAFALAWFAAFTEAGHALGDATSDGTLERGIRDILAHHVIFHWNRLGLTAASQSIIARAAFETIMNPPGSVPNTRLGTTPDVAGA